MAKYREKSVVVEAVQWTGANRVEIARFVKGSDLTIDDRMLVPGDSVFIDASGRCVCADKGDWIIKGAGNEFYPCKPNIFHAAYELVEDHTHAR